MDSKIKRVEIIAPVHNRRDITLQCLRSLSRINKENLEVHIIIVDDGSTDGTEESINREFPEVEVIRGDGNLWFTGGTNLGIETALKYNPDYILTINDDEVFDENFLKFMVECAETNPRSIIGSLLLLWDEPHKLFQVSPKWNTFTGGFRHWYKQTIWTVPENPWEVEIIVGNCVLFPVEAIKESGLMNQKRHPHYGDSEYTPRMRRNGWKLLIEPRARVFCQPNNVAPSLKKMGMKKLLRTLFIDKGNGNSFYRRFWGTVDSAPNKIAGFSAFFIFYIRLLMNKNSEGSWAVNSEEKHLKEIFADKIIKN